jgi:hypothetical protein
MPPQKPINRWFDGREYPLRIIWRKRVDASVFSIEKSKNIESIQPSWVPLIAPRTTFPD